MKKSILALTLAALMFCAIFATGALAVPKTKPAAGAITLNKTEVVLKPKASFTIKPTILPRAASKAVTYTSSDESVAKVTAKGKVTAVGNGKATITVTSADGNASAVCEITVGVKPKGDMSVTSSGIVNGTLDDKYGQYGTQKNSGVPTRSMPLSVTDAPLGTVSYAVIMMDPDSKPLCGYEWIHWVAADITSAQIAENASIDNADSMVQGRNSFGTIGYGGPTPPNKPHTYTITVYALDAKMGLASGFTRDKLLAAMDGHILAQVTIKGIYRN